ncbi:anti-sigma factor antagonist [Lysinibacillus endophyticus]|uniref:Anti-sigma factor antagonist n=1 Tax=Ureibacillus endophyticus TaxID=1978490 RepID=A0A494Z2P2_9BACL|nr:anti-sigma factor antagonist [Lysinibacillus endophyticus]
MPAESVHTEWKSTFTTSKNQHFFVPASYYNKGGLEVLKTVNNVIQVLEWKENITLKNIELFRQEMNNLLNQDSQNLILNLAETTYINSAGLGIIAESVVQAKRNNKELVISNMEDSIKEIFSIVKFSSFMKLFEIEKEAIEYFQAIDHD